MTSRTTVYIEPEQLAALKKRAEAQRTSMADLLRRLVRDYLDEHHGVGPVSPEAYASLVGLGSSGSPDIGDAHDRRLAEALAREHLR